MLRVGESKLIASRFTGREVLREGILEASVYHMGLGIWNPLLYQLSYWPIHIILFDIFKNTIFLITGILLVITGRKTGIFNRFYSLNKLCVNARPAPILSALPWL